jgi:uncharacterized RDD family membrane protein YckC
MPSEAPSPIPAANPLQIAQLWPRFGAIVYESVLLFGVSFIASWITVPLLGETANGAMLAAYRGYLLVVFGIYFIYCWRRSGQTLAMKTWGLRLRRADGQPLTLPVAIGRYVLAVAGLLCAGAGFLWALVDRDRQFLHDRLMGTRILRAPF